MCIYVYVYICICMYVCVYGCPGTGYVDKASFMLTDPPASASGVLGSKLPYPAMIIHFYPNPFQSKLAVWLPTAYIPSVM